MFYNFHNAKIPLQYPFVIFLIKLYVKSSILGMLRHIRGMKKAAPDWRIPYYRDPLLP